MEWWMCITVSIGLLTVTQSVSTEISFKLDRVRVVHSDVILNIPHDKYIDGCYDYSQITDFVERIKAKAVLHNQLAYVPQEGDKELHPTIEIIEADRHPWSTENIIKFRTGLVRDADKDCYANGGSLPDPWDDYELTAITKGIKDRNILYQPIPARFVGDDVVSSISGYVYNIKINYTKTKYTSVFGVNQQGKIVVVPEGYANSSHKYMCVMPQEDFMLSAVHRWSVPERIRQFKVVVGELIDTCDVFQTKHLTFPNRTRHTNGKGCDSLLASPEWLVIYNKCLSFKFTQRMEYQDYTKCVTAINGMMDKINDFEEAFTNKDKLVIMGGQVFFITHVLSSTQVEYSRMLFVRSRAVVFKVLGTPPFVYPYVGQLKNGTCLGMSNMPDCFGGKCTSYSMKPLEDKCCKDIEHENQNIDCPRVTSSVNLHKTAYVMYIILYSLISSVGGAYAALALYYLGVCAKGYEAAKKAGKNPFIECITYGCRKKTQGNNSNREEEIPLRIGSRDPSSPILMHHHQVGQGQSRSIQLPYRGHFGYLFPSRVSADTLRR